MSLRRLILTFKPGGLEVLDVERSGVNAPVLHARDGPDDCVGTSGFTTREDVLLVTTSPATAKLVKGA